VNGADVAAAITVVLSWTPIGAVWAVPASVAVGEIQQGLLQLLIAATFAYVLWKLWEMLVSLLLITPERQGSSRSFAGIGWFDHLPASRTGAIAARSLTYWARDPRYRVSLIMVPVVPVLVFVPLYIAGVPVEYLYLLPLPIMCLFLGWSLHNDVAHDNTAFWLHIASGVPGRADRLGRLVPVLIWAVPLIIVGSVVTAWFYGEWLIVGSLIGVSWCLVGAGLGLSSVLSIAFPYAAVRPGDSPFQQPQNTGATGALIQAVSFFASLILAAPVIWMAVMGMMEPGDWEIAALLSGLAIGTVTLLAGVEGGAAVYTRRAPEVLTFAQSF
jgi:ABC-2 type transport system permease protein